MTHDQDHRHLLIHMPLISYFSACSLSPVMGYSCLCALSLISL